MCSPQQAVGAPALSQNVEAMTAATDRQLQQERVKRAQSIERAERESRRAEQDALIRAGKRFGRQNSIGAGGRGNPALGGTLSQGGTLNQSVNGSLGR